MAAHFNEAALKFLRGLKRNNDRAWFDARKPVYEAELRQPLLTLIEEVNEHLDGFAPEFVRPAQKIAMRIYRDIRFSKNKDPYKTNIAAWWARQGLEKTSGGGFYLEISPAGVMIAAGCYMPEREQLLAIRRHLLDHHAELRRITSAKKFTATFQPLDGLKLTRAPKGFPPDHPALDLILQKQWVVTSSLPAETALDRKLVPAIVERFRLALPMVQFLNAAITPPAGSTARPIF